MKNFVLRPARYSDMDDIIFNWTTCFGDEPGLPRELLSRCDLLRSGLVADCDGHAVSCLFLFHGLQFGEISASYLYALCTRPEYEGQGIGSALMGFASEQSFAHGSHMLLLQPGDYGLEQWYARLGFSTLYRCEDKSLDVSGISPSPARVISAEEYSSRRHGLPVTGQLLKAQETLLRCCGGAFLDTGWGTVCAEHDGFNVRLREANCSPALLKKNAASAAAHFGAEHVLVRCKSNSEGEFCLMCHCREGMTLPDLDGLFFPFTLD